MKSFSLLIALMSASCFSALLSPSDASAQSFSIATRGDDVVCRTQSGTPDVCYPTLQRLGRPGFNVIELIPRLQSYVGYLANPAPFTPETAKSYGGAIILPPQEVREALRQFNQLSVRNIAIDPSKAIVDGNEVRYPFFGSVYWKGNSSMNGTLHFEGYFRVPRQLAVTSLLSTDISSTHANYVRSVRLTNFADSATAQNVPVMSLIEKGAREVHFRWAGKTARPVDEETSAMLGNLVIPMVVAETFYIPEMSRMNAEWYRLYLAPPASALR